MYRHPMILEHSTHLLCAFFHMTGNRTDGFSSGCTLTAFVIHGRCRDNLSAASSIPFYFLQKLGGRRDECSSQDERTRWRGKLSDYSRLDKELLRGWQKTWREGRRGRGRQERRRRRTGSWHRVPRVAVAVGARRSYRMKSRADGLSFSKDGPGRTLKHPPTRIQSRRSTK